MSQTKPQPKAGDDCPQCGGHLTLRPAPTPDEQARAANKENPLVLAPHYDTATPAQIAELGSLYECDRCHYQTRMHGAPGEVADEPAAAGAGKGKPKRTPANGD